MVGCEAPCASVVPRKKAGLRRLFRCEQAYFCVVVLELVLCPASPLALPGPRDSGFSRSLALLLPEKPVVAPP